jgi:hypothetical protein
MVGQHILNSLFQELPVFRVNKLQIFFHCRRLATRIKAVDLEQLRRPVIESGSVEGPNPCMGKPLSFREVEFGLFAFFNVEIDPDPI